ncbi:MAG TPA: DNA polymerase Y family protein [Terriglobales bacterium]|jgi:protein ImuB|nr:DNA polymerase Y family protein [Terriglobales bacterium]
MLFACIYVPEFPVQAIARTASELRERPVAVLDGTPPLLTIIAANQQARELGVDIGMTKVQSEACPNIHLCRRSIAQEEAAYSALLDCTYAFSPRVEDSSRRTANPDDKTKSSDTVILDITGLERLFGSPSIIARRIRSHVSTMGLAASVAIAGNPDSAMYAARGFSGMTIIVPGTEAKRLGSLPIQLLQPPAEMLETFERWGIRDFAALAALPEIALSQRLGQEGLHLQKLAQGRTERTLVPAESITKFEESIELEDAVELLEPLAFILNRLLEQICARLAARSLAANELRITLELTGHEDQSIEEQEQSKSTYQRSFQFPVPMQDSRTFLKLLQLDLAAHPPGGPVKKIFLAAEAAPPRFAQSGLFLPRGPAPERLELTLARIRGIAGDDRVGSAELLDTHAPSGFRMCAFRPYTKASKSHDRPRTQRTALRIFRPPLAIKVQMQNEMPARVFFRGQTHRVTAAAGPWRNNGGWWTTQAWTRDEWDIELRAEQSSPMLVRMYRDLNSAKWYLEGAFD